MSDLMRYVNGEMKPKGKGERDLANNSKMVVGTIQLAGLKSEGIAALAGKIMQDIAELDNHRRALAGDDPVLNKLLGEIELNAARQMGRIQNSTFSKWGL